MNLFDMLKAEKDIPVSDPMARLWGYQYQQKHGVSEISGVPPLRFTSRGGYLQDYRIYGNTVQNGIPTPENPVEVQGCGERTENLFTSAISETKKSKGITIHCDGAGKYHVYGTTGSASVSIGFELPEFVIPISMTLGGNGTFSMFNTYTVGHIVLGNDDGLDDVWNVNAINRCSISYIAMGQKKITTITFNIPANVLVDGYISPMITNNGMLPNEFEPYGYKIPVNASNGTETVTTPVYIGSEPLHKIGDYADYVDFKRGVVIRRIKKIAYTGKENLIKGVTIRQKTSRIALDTIPSAIDIGNIVGRNIRCDRFTPADLFNQDIIGVEQIGRDIFLSFPSSVGITSVSTANTYFAEQYSAGTPVTVWYVLATPEEEPLENLLPIQTIKGSDVLTVDTTVQPSNIWIKGKIKAID